MNRLFLCIIFIVFVLTASLCTAQDISTSQSSEINEDKGSWNKYYIIPSVSYFNIELPDFKPVAKMDTSTRAYIDSFDIDNGEGYGPILEMKFGLNRDENNFFELRCFYSEIIIDHSGIYEFTPEYDVGYFPVNGDTHNMIDPEGDPSKLCITRDVDYFGFDLNMSKRNIRNESLTFSSFWGASFFWLNQDFSTQFKKTNAPTDISYQNDNLYSGYYGFKGGVRVEFEKNRFVGNISFDVGGYYVNTKYKANNYKDSDGPALLYLSYCEDSSDDFCAGVNFNAGLDYDLKNDWKIGIAGGLEYLSYVPEIVASTKSTNNATGESAHIVDGDSFAWKLGLYGKYVF